MTMDYIQWRAYNRTKDRGISTMPIFRYDIHPRDQPSDSRRYVWHGKGGYTECSK